MAKTDLRPDGGSGRMDGAWSGARRWFLLILNLVIVLLTAVAIVQMLNSRGNKLLTTYGIANLKYFTVLSNIFEGIASLCLAFRLLAAGRGGQRAFRRMFLLKYMAACSVALTFLVVALFFGPLYGHFLLYEGSNFWFHLVIPVLAMLEFIFLDRFDELRFRDTLFAALPPLVYGLAYCVNLLINGVGTPPDHLNDIYGFLLWGLPVGLCIFAGILLVAWAAGILLRLGNRALRKEAESVTTGEDKNI